MSNNKYLTYLQELAYETMMQYYQQEYERNQPSMHAIIDGYQLTLLGLTHWQMQDLQDGHFLSEVHMVLRNRCQMDIYDSSCRVRTRIEAGEEEDTFTKIIEMRLIEIDR